MKKSAGYEKILGVCLFVSLFFHFLIGFIGQDFLQKTDSNEASKINRIDLVIKEDQSFFNLREKKKSLKNQVIEQEKSLSYNSEIPDKTHYLGKFNQKVKEESKARHSGRFVNSSLALAEKKPQIFFQKDRKNFFLSSESRSQKNSLNLKDLNHRFSFKPESERLSSFLPPDRLKKGDTFSSLSHSVSQPTSLNRSPSFIPSSVSSSPSMTSDDIQGVKVGIKTLLNSRKFVYYFFYQRIREKLLFHWEHYLERMEESTSSDMKALKFKKDYTTKVMVVLNQKGSLLHVKILEPSGIKGLDEAAVAAFQDAGPFLNPPTGMKDKSGHIHLRWDFTYEII